MFEKFLDGIDKRLPTIVIAKCILDRSESMPHDNILKSEIYKSMFRERKAKLNAKMVASEICNLKLNTTKKIPEVDNVDLTTIWGMPNKMDACATCGFFNLAALYHGQYLKNTFPDSKEVANIVNKLASYELLHVSEAIALTKYLRNNTKLRRVGTKTMYKTLIDIFKMSDKMTIVSASKCKDYLRNNPHIGFSAHIKTLGYKHVVTFIRKHDNPDHYYLIDNALISLIHIDDIKLCDLCYVLKDEIDYSSYNIDYTNNPLGAKIS